MIPKKLERELFDCPALASGWKREVVYRKPGDKKQIDVYYHSPEGRKFRSKPQLAVALGENVDLTNFKFQSGVFSNSKSKKSRPSSEDTDTEDDPPAKKPRIRASKKYQDSRLTCSACDKSFPQNNALLNHVVTRHVRKSDHVCHICDRAFYSVKSVKAHYRLTHAIGVMSGKTKLDAEEEDQEETDTENESEEDADEKEENGVTCGDEKSTEHNPLHQDTNSNCSRSAGPPRPTCAECGKSFMTSSSLSIHMMNHTGESPLSRDQPEEQAKPHTECTENST